MLALHRVCVAIPFPQPPASLVVGFHPNCTACEDLTVSQFAPVLEGYRGNMLRGARAACAIQCILMQTYPDVANPTPTFDGDCQVGCDSLNISNPEQLGSDNKQVAMLRAARIGCYETCQEVLGDLDEQTAAADDCDAVCEGLKVGDRFGHVVAMSKVACKAQCEVPWTEVPSVVNFDESNCTRDCEGELKIPDVTDLGVYEDAILNAAKAGCAIAGCHRDEVRIGNTVVHSMAASGRVESSDEPAHEADSGESYLIDGDDVILNGSITDEIVTP